VRRPSFPAWARLASPLAGREWGPRRGEGASGGAPRGAAPRAPAPTPAPAPTLQRLSPVACDPSYCPRRRLRCALPAAAPTADLLGDTARVARGPFLLGSSSWCTRGPPCPCVPPLHWSPGAL